MSTIQMREGKGVELGDEVISMVARPTRLTIPCKLGGNRPWKGGHSHVLRVANAITSDQSYSWISK